MTYLQLKRMIILLVWTKTKKILMLCLKRLSILVKLKFIRIQIQVK